MPFALLGVEKSINELVELFKHAKSGASGSSVSDQDSAARKGATSKQQTAVTNWVGDRGYRDNDISKTDKYGSISGATNSSKHEASEANISRNIVITLPRTIDMSADALSKMTSEDDTALLQGRSKGWAALVEWSKRMHYLSTICHILMTARVLPFIDATLNDRRYNAITMHLHHLGLPGGSRSLRPYEINRQLTYQLTIERVITLVFDMGIRGPDPSKPFQISDMECMVPLMYVPESVTALVLELAPVIIDPVMIQIFQTLQRVCNWYPSSLDVRSSSHPEYYCDHKLLNKYKPGSGRGSEVYAAIELMSQLMERGVMYQDKTVLGTIAVLMRACVPAYTADGTYQTLPGIKIEGPGEANTLLVHHKPIHNFSDPNVLWNAYCAVAGRIVGGDDEEEAPLFVRGMTAPNEPDVALTGRFRAPPDVANIAAKQALADAKYQDELEKYKEALKNDFPAEVSEIERLRASKVTTESKLVRRDKVLEKLKKQMVEAEQKQDELAFADLENERLKCEEERTNTKTQLDQLTLTLQARERELELKKSHIHKPVPVKVHDPRRVKNPNYQPPEKTRKIPRGGLGDMDIREVSSDYLEEKQPEYLVPSPNDEFKTARRFNLKQGVVKTKEEFAQHYANPRNLPVLVDKYYRFKDSCCDVYDVVQRIQIHKVRVAHSEGKEIEMSQLPFLDLALRFKKDKKMVDAATDTDEEKKEEDVFARLQRKLHRRLQELTKVYCERWNTYLSYKALKRDSLHSHWVYADLMINWLRRAVNNQSWTQDAVLRLSKVIFQAWQTQVIQEEELQKLAKECVYGAPQAMDVDDNKEDAPPALEDEAKMEEARRRDSNRMEELQKVYRQRRKRPRVRRVEEYSGAEEEEGKSSSNVPFISDSSADEAEERPRSRTRFDFLVDEATRDCIAPPPSVVTNMDME